MSAKSLRVRLRGSGQDDRYRPLIADLGIADMVSLEARIPYRDALAEMQAVDGLLLFQGADANQQVPAKLFEYLRAGVPILGLLAPGGDTAGFLRDEGVGRIAAIDDVNEIKDAIADFVLRAEVRCSWAAPADVASRYSRRAATAKLAAVFDAFGEQAVRMT